MEVTRENFGEVLNSIEELLPSCEFIAYDTEFTGISHFSQSQVPVSPYDTLAERYKRMRVVASDDIVIQFGIALFERKEHSSFKAHVFSFYVFPAVSRILSLEKFFLCQSSSLDFLASNGFNFNKWIKEGIPFVSNETVNELKKKISRRIYSLSTPPKPPLQSLMNQLSSEDKKFLSDTKDKVSKWLSTKVEMEPKSLILEPCNAFLRKVLHEVLPYEFENLRTSGIGTSAGRCVSVTLSSSSELEQKKKGEKEKLETELDRVTGFKKVFDLLKNSGKPIVGHNCLYDLMFTLHHCDKSIPPSLEEFIEQATQFSSCLLDTKLISSEINDGRWAYTSLSTLHKYYAGKESRVTVHAENMNEGEEAYHNAGYDAYATGFILLHMLAEKQSKISGSFGAKELEVLIQLSSQKIAVPRHSDYLDLRCYEKQERDLSNVFVVSQIRETDEQDVVEKVFDNMGKIRVRWISSSCACVEIEGSEISETIVPPEDFSYLRVEKYPSVLKVDDDSEMMSGRKRKRSMDDTDGPSRKNRKLSKCSIQ